MLMRGESTGAGAAAGLPVVDFEVVEGGGRLLADPWARCGPPAEDDMRLGLRMEGWDKAWDQQIAQCGGREWQQAGSPPPSLPLDC